MGWQAAVVGAMGVAQYKSQGAIGDFNEAVNDRNAKVLEQQATAIERKTEFDLKQFDKEFVKLRGQTVVAIAKTGATYSGSGLRVARANEKEKILQENLNKIPDQDKKDSISDSYNSFLELKKQSSNNIILLAKEEEKIKLYKNKIKNHKCVYNSNCNECNINKKENGFTQLEQDLEEHIPTSSNIVFLPV